MAHQDSLGFLMADVSRLMRRMFQERLESSSLTLAQARALIYISRSEGIRQVDLAEMLEVRPITLGRLVDQLATGSLVERRPDPADRRVYRLFLLPAANEQLTAIRNAGAIIQEQALKQLDSDQSSAVLSALSIMRENLCGVKKV